MPYYLWQCKKCKTEANVLRKIAEYEIPPITIEPCGDSDSDDHDWERLIADVNFSSTERHVGKMEAGRDRTFHELKESYKIEAEMMNLPESKRGEHRKEVKKLRSTNPGKE